jgi:hypothetical protein
MQGIILSSFTLHLSPLPAGRQASPFISPLNSFLSCFCQKKSERITAAKTDIPPRVYAIRIRV